MVYQQFLEDIEKTEEGHYQDGRKVGVWRYWSDVDGEIIRREQYYFSD